jgi:hypothetical protein
VVFYSLEKENKKWSCNKLLMIKKFVLTVITLEITLLGALYSPSGANKSSRIAK